MSQMPDKIWLHKDTKYSTADEVLGYQYDCAQEILCDGIENFVEYVKKDALIYKACEWLNNNLIDYWSRQNAHPATFINDFKKAMEE